MGYLLVILGIIGIFVGLILLVIGLIKRKKMKGGLVLGISFAAFVVGFIMVPTDSEELANDSKEKVETAVKPKEETTKEKAEREVKEAEQKTKEEQAAKDKKEHEEATAESQPVSNEINSETDSKMEIKKIVKSIVSSDLNKTIVKDIAVNNYQAEENKYIVLPHLKWEVENSKKTTVEMLEMYSDHIAATLYEQSGVEEITVFWEVPYHVTGDNIAKFNYLRKDGGMAKNEKWLAPVLR